MHTQSSSIVISNVDDRYCNKGVLRSWKGFEKSWDIGREGRAQV